MKTAHNIEGHKLILDKNIIYHYNNNKLYKTVSFVTNEDAKKEFKKLTKFQERRGAPKKHKSPQARVFYMQLIIQA